ncbi:MAG TPA: alanine--glyoxylate aminotransferase family protein [Candidatus Caldiarchaeum subterraneum]|uniref:Alanine--glyoxylate aminotransferase family protein n=1 Tax=Caldiarchaeum subterraneum TaxID=311458 RepID=A0A833EAC4_CALS0|nr:alanine--glyoxylate aminotransferase family protein [Candidatus Caldarchaeum subterraneum]
MQEYGELLPPERLLLGPGPANVDPRVLRSLSLPVVGYTDPFLYGVLDDIQELLRYVFQTSNRLTLPVSGTGSAGMEMAVHNLVEEGDEVVVGIAGFFGDRIVQVIKRAGGKVIPVETEWGRALEAEKIEDALKNSNAEVIAVVHGETSTGVLQPLEKIAKIAKEYDALLLVDAVTTLGGSEIKVDGLGIDACYSCSQKCLGCTPGLAPVTFSKKAYDKIANRKKELRSWYLDVRLVEKYWSGDRVYHHTPPVSMLYALREALRIIREEGIEDRWRRHETTGRALIRGLEALGMALLVEDEEIRLPQLTTVLIPNGLDDAATRKELLERYGIEIGGGLGPFKGKVWRIGLMGYNANVKNVLHLLSALEKILKKHGFPVKNGEAVKAASEYLESR